MFFPYFCSHLMARAAHQGIADKRSNRIPGRFYFFFSAHGNTELFLLASLSLMLLKWQIRSTPSLLAHLCLRPKVKF